MPVHAVQVAWSTHMEKLRAIRARVFIEEQHVPKDLEWDGLDDAADHFIALNEMGVSLGTARLLETGQIGRMAVLAEHRGKGIGRQLLDAAVAHAVSKGARRVFLHAQRHAEAFYRKAGFLPTGMEMMEAGIPHLEMEMVLPIPFASSTETRGLALVNRDTASPDARPSAFKSFDTEFECRAAVIELILNARRTVSILSPTLDQALFANAECLAAISSMARRSRSAKVRILVEDTKAIAEMAHPLLELARRLPSKVEMRRLADDDVPRRSFVVVDQEAVWVQPDRDAYVGWSNLHDRVEARRLLEEFTTLHEHSTDDPELRLLSL
jgi:predicted GNAT family N-acyltransferase